MTYYVTGLLLLSAEVKTDGFFVLQSHCIMCYIHIIRNRKCLAVRNQAVYSPQWRLVNTESKYDICTNSYWVTLDYHCTLTLEKTFFTETLINTNQARRPPCGLCLCVLVELWHKADLTVQSSNVEWQVMLNVCLGIKCKEWVKKSQTPSLLGD